MARVDLAALSDGLLADACAAAPDLARTACFFFIADPLYFLI
jgi:hypothetical protein